MKAVRSAEAGAANAPTSIRAARAGRLKSRETGRMPVKVSQDRGRPRPAAERHAMDFRLSDDQIVLRGAVREFAEREILPHVMEWDEAQAFPPALVGQMAELGLLGIQLPDAYGGAAMSAVDYCLAIEELARVCPAVALSVAAPNGPRVA